MAVILSRGTLIIQWWSGSVNIWMWNSSLLTVSSSLRCWIYDRCMWMICFVLQWRIWNLRTVAATITHVRVTLEWPWPSLQVTCNSNHRSRRQVAGKAVSLHEVFSEPVRIRRNANHNGSTDRNGNYSYHPGGHYWDYMYNPGVLSFIKVTATHLKSGWSWMKSTGPRFS